MYNRTVWQDHVVEYPNRFVETDNGNGTTDHVPSPGNTLQLGTNQDAEHFNNFEEGMMLLAAAFNLNYSTQQAVTRDLDARLALAESKLAVLP